MPWDVKISRPTRFFWGNLLTIFPGALSLLHEVKKYSKSRSRPARTILIIPIKNIEPVKISLKTLFFFVIYILMCFGVLFLATQESTAQPIGLLVVAMVMTPIIIAICAGLPVDFMKLKQSKVQDS